MFLVVCLNLQKMNSLNLKVIITGIGLAYVSLFLFCLPAAIIPLKMGNLYRTSHAALAPAMADPERLLKS